MTNTQPARRPWWKWYWTTWLSSGLMLACILFANCHRFIVSRFNFDDFEFLTASAPWLGWPAPFWSTRYSIGWTVNPLSSFSTAPNVLPPVPPLIVGALVFDIFFAILVVSSVSAAVQLLRTRHQFLFRLTILQILMTTAFVALWLVAENLAKPRVHIGIYPPSKVPAIVQICDTVAPVVKLFIFAALGSSIFFLARPEWWRRSRAVENGEEAE